MNETLKRIIRALFGTKHVRLAKQGEAYAYEVYIRYPFGRIEILETGTASPGAIVWVGRGAKMEHVERWVWNGRGFDSA